MAILRVRCHERGLSALAGAVQAAGEICVLYCPLHSILFIYLGDGLSIKLNKLSV